MIAGAGDQQGWFKNLIADPKISLQVGGRKYRGASRIAEGEERERFWSEMIKLYPPFPSYPPKSGGKLPVVVLEPREEVDKL